MPRMGQGSADRIVADLREWIREAGPGAQLPSSRTLVARYEASPVTVQRAMRTLISLGLVDSRPGAGSFVRAVRATRTVNVNWQAGALRTANARTPSLPTALRDISLETIGLHSGFPAAELLPERAVRVALARAARADAAMSRSPVAGLPELQNWFATELASATPAGVVAPASRDVIVVPGTQSGLSSIFRTLAGPGKPVVMESPTYWGAILAAAQAGVQIVPVASDANGPDPADVARAFAETGARVFYAQPNFANPTGAQWSPRRREEIMSVVRDNGAFLVEDDWAHDFGIDSEPVPMAAHDDAGHVVYLRSLTKSVSPAVRVGAVIARGPVRDRILADRAAESMYVSGVLQAAALEVVLQPAWRTHLRNLRAQLRDRRDLLARCLADYAPHAVVDQLPRGGLNLWVRLPDEVELDRLVRDCANADLVIPAGTEWFPAEPTGTYTRLNFAGADPARFADGARVLGQALADQLR